MQHAVCLTPWKRFNSGPYACFLFVLSRRSALPPLYPTPAFVSAVCLCVLPPSKILHFAIWEGLGKKREIVYWILACAGRLKSIFVTSWQFLSAPPTHFQTFPYLLLGFNLCYRFVHHQLLYENMKEKNNTDLHCFIFLGCFALLWTANSLSVSYHHGFGLVTIHPSIHPVKKPQGLLRLQRRQKIWILSQTWLYFF